MTTLVTGGAGFIGSHVARRLLAEGEPVVVIDNFNDYYDPALKRSNAAQIAELPNATLIEADIREADLMLEIFQKYRFQRVAHLAAMAGVRASPEQAPLYMSVNAMGSLNLLEAARKTNVEIFMQASTSSVYGATQRLPFTEDDSADRPLAPYPASKRSAEILAHSYHHLFGMNITALRFFNVYGPAGRPDMMPMRLMHAITQGKPVTLFNDGEIQRDWTFIEDTVEGVYAALTRPLGYELINLGLGQPISINEFVDAIEELSGKMALRTYSPAPPTEPPITYCNNEKAQRLLDFQPRTSVFDGLAKTWAWFTRTFPH